MSHEVTAPTAPVQTTVPAREMFAAFLDTRRERLTRRAARIHHEVLDLLVEYLDTLGIRELDLRPINAEGDTLPGIPWLGASVDIDTLIALFDDFSEDYLVRTIKAERTFLRVTDVALRDLSGWLRSKRLQVTQELPKRLPTAAYPVIPAGCFEPPAPRRHRPGHTPSHARRVEPRAALTRAYPIVSAEQTGTMWRLDPFRAD